MEYFDAITLLGTDGFQDTDLSDLKKIKKKIFLEFELNGSETLVRDDYEFDKNDVISIFEILENKLELFKSVNRISSLDQFFAKDSLRFFREDDYEQLQDFNPELNEGIHDLIVQHLNEIIPSLVMASSKKSRENLEDIRAYMELLPDLQIQQAYKKTYEELTTLFVELNKIEMPFTEEWGEVFLPVVQKYVRNDFYDTLSLLPASMDNFCREFCMWIGNIVVFALTSRNHKIFQVSTLTTLRDAMKIASRDVNTKQIEEWIAEIDRTIQNKKIIDREVRGFTIDKDDKSDIRFAFRIVAVIIGIISLLVFCIRFYNFRH